MPAACGAGGSGRSLGVPETVGAGTTEAAAAGGAGAQRLRDGIDAAGEAGAGDGTCGAARAWPWGDRPGPACHPGRPRLGNASLVLLREEAEDGHEGVDD